LGCVVKQTVTISQTIPERNGQTDTIAISTSHVSTLTHDKN